MIEISFPRTVCKYCGSNLQKAELKKYRYGIYCAGCGKLIRWASQDEAVIIRSRKAWLDKNG